MITRTLAPCFGVVAKLVRHMSSTEQGGGALRVTRLEAGNEGVLVLGFNRPHVRNAISFDMITQFQDVLSSAQFDEGVRLIVLRSETQGVFCAGADLKERLAQSDTTYRKWSQTVRAMTSQLAGVDVPVIAAVDGHALGGGLELALACDLRVAATNVRVGLPETTLAIIPGAGGTQRMQRVIRAARAKELIFTGRVLTAHTAHSYGIVNLLVEQNSTGDAAYQKSLEMASTMIQMSGATGGRVRSLHPLLIPTNADFNGYCLGICFMQPCK